MKLKLIVWLDREQIEMLSNSLRVNCGECHLLGKSVEIELAPSSSGMLKNTKLLDLQDTSHEAEAKQ